MESIGLVWSVQAEWLNDGVSNYILLVEETRVAQLIKVCSKLWSCGVWKSTSNNASTKCHFVVSVKVEVACSLSLLTWVCVFASELLRVYMTCWCHKSLLHVVSGRFEVLFEVSLELGCKLLVMLCIHFFGRTAAKIFTWCSLPFLWCLCHSTSHRIRRNGGRRVLEVFFLCFALDWRPLICKTLIL